MQDAFEEAAEALVDALGELASYSGANGAADVRGIFSNAHQRVETPRGAAISSARPEFSIVKSAIDFEPLAGDVLEIRGVDYAIAVIRPDEENTQLTFGLKRA